MHWLLLGYVLLNPAPSIERSYLELQIYGAIGDPILRAVSYYPEKMLNHMH